VTCLLITHVAAMLFIPSAWLSLANERTGISAFFGLSNFVLAQTGNDYFSPKAEFNPYTHTWSLGVEEQFYLIFPPLFLAWIAGGHWRRLSMLLFGIGLVASIACAWWWAKADQELAFYMLFSRFWELAAGVLLYQILSFSGHAFSETGRPATRWSQAGAIASVALIIAGFVIAHPISFPFPGGLLPALGTLGLLVSLHGREPRGPIMRVLRFPIVVFIGQISYSLYLWHWPVFVLFRWTVGIESVAARIAAVAITFLLAIASYLFVERPPRRSPALRAAPRFAVIASGVGLVAASVLIAHQVTLHAPQLSLNTVARHMPEWYPGRLTGDEKSDCRLTTRVKDIGGGTRAVLSGSDCRHPHAPMPRLFVIGDSHAGAYSTMLQMFAMDTGAEVYIYANGGCPFLSLQPEREVASCPRHTSVSVADILRTASKGDILFLPSLRLERLSNQYEPSKAPAAWNAMLRTGAAPARDTRHAIDVLKPFAALGMRIVFDAPKPIFRSPPFRCADWFNADNPICAPGTTMSRAELERYRRSVLDAFTQISRQVAGVSVWDPFPMLCPGDECQTSVDGRPLFFDGDHLSGYANRLLLPKFENYVTSLVGAAPLTTDLR
jgi:peptidoglycan/LPS O-acetylase OafA/YrhL